MLAVIFYSALVLAFYLILVFFGRAVYRMTHSADLLARLRAMEYVALAVWLPLGCLLGYVFLTTHIRPTPGPFPYGSGTTGLILQWSFVIGFITVFWMPFSLLGQVKDSDAIAFRLTGKRLLGRNRYRSTTLPTYHPGDRFGAQTLNELRKSEPGPAPFRRNAKRIAESAETLAGTVDNPSTPPSPPPQAPATPVAHHVPSRDRRREPSLLREHRERCYEEQSRGGIWSTRAAYVQLAAFVGWFLLDGSQYVFHRQAMGQGAPVDPGPFGFVFIAILMATVVLIQSRPPRWRWLTSSLCISGALLAIWLHTI